jgi:hypothetical protein
MMCQARIQNECALSKALFSLRRRNGFGARKALLPLCARTNKQKKAATLQRVAAFLELKGVSVKRAFGV